MGGENERKEWDEKTGGTEREERNERKEQE